MLDITDPEILWTEKFGSRSDIKVKDDNCRKVKYTDGNWIISKTKLNDKGERQK